MSGGVVKGMGLTNPRVSKGNAGQDTGSDLGLREGEEQQSRPGRRRESRIPALKGIDAPELRALPYAVDLPSHVPSLSPS